MTDQGCNPWTFFLGSTGDNERTTFFPMPPEFTEPLRTGSRLRVRIATMKATNLVAMLALLASLAAPLDATEETVTPRGELSKRLIAYLAFMSLVIGLAVLPRHEN